MAELTEYLPAFSMSIIRPLGVFLFLPLLNSAVLGGLLIRNALLILVALPVTFAGPEWPSHGSNVGAYLLLVASELAIGLFIGFCAAIPFWALDIAGYVIDTMSGSSMASVYNPLLGKQSSLLGLLFSQTFNVLFLLNGCFNTLIETIYRSYIILPPGSSISFSPAGILFLTSQWQLMYEMGLRFAMPAMVVILLVDIALGLVNRSAQQLNVFFLSMPIKNAFSLLMLILSFSFAFYSLLSYSMDFHRLTDKIWQYLK